MAINIGTIIGSVADAADVASTFKDARKEGRGFIGASAKAATQQAMWMFAPAAVWTTMGVQLAKTGYDVAKATSPERIRQQSSQYAHTFGGNFMDTEANSTMRQRGLRAIEQSGQNLNSVFGSEARTYFRGSY